MADSVNWLSQYLLHLSTVRRLENKKLYVPYSLYLACRMLVRLYQSGAFAGVLNV